MNFDVGQIVRCVDPDDRKLVFGQRYLITAEIWQSGRQYILLDGGTDPWLANRFAPDLLNSNIEALIADQAAWSQATFGSDESRGPIGTLKHLAKEAVEAQEAFGTDTFEEELADCLLLLFDATRRGKSSIYRILIAAEKKMEVLKQRRTGRAY